MSNAWNTLGPSVWNLLRTVSYASGALTTLARREEVGLIKKSLNEFLELYDASPKPYSPSGTLGHDINVVVQNINNFSNEHCEDEYRYEHKIRVTLDRVVELTKHWIEQ